MGVLPQIVKYVAKGILCDLILFVLDPGLF